MKKFISAMLAAGLAFTMAFGAAAECEESAEGAGAATEFTVLTDVAPGSWYYAEVSAMAASGVIDGYGDGSFRPERIVTVAEAVTMTARMTGAETGEADGYWCGVQMDNAYRSGWISEADAARTEMDKPVTRELACKIISAALALSYPAGTVLPFTDAGEVGPGYLSSVMAMYANGLIAGYEDGTLRPQDTLTRAQAAALLYRAAHLGAEAGEDFVTAEGYSAGQIIDYYCDVGLGAEYGGDEDVVIKWAVPIRYSISGNATDDDLERLSALVEALNAVPGFPGISPAGDSESANVRISFVNTEAMAAECGGAYNGYVTVNWNGKHEITSGVIYYNSEIAQELRNSVIVEELCQCLGLLTDTYDHPESVFYQYHTDADWPCALDWAIIELLYRSELVPGMDEGAVRGAAAAIVR